MDVVCVCNEKDRKCKDDSCEEYVVKFTPIERTRENKLSKSPKFRANNMRRLTSELNRTANHINKITKKIK